MKIYLVIWALLGKSRFKFHVGDRVRIVKKKKAFDKGYTPRWTEEVNLQLQNNNIPNTAYV